jgi:outer membrane protein OmpA-like peptidoglycan-associated protein
LLAAAAAPLLASCAGSGPPQQAPSPPPAVIADRAYIVFFPWNSAEIGERGRQIIAEAAKNLGTVERRTGRIELDAYADRSGPRGYNQRLSRRRAEAVAAELVRDGVQRSAITVQAFGESRPLVPTADGVREPQNRRVEIVLR